jgi:hypothetical protein
MRRVNDWLALKITNAVGTMWCAGLFALLACVSLPNAIASGDPVTLVSWVSQTFLQLVLLSVILVGQGIIERTRAEHSDQLAALHDKTDALHAKHDDLHAKIQEVAK